MGPGLSRGWSGSHINQVVFEMLSCLPLNLNYKNANCSVVNFNFTSICLSTYHSGITKACYRQAQLIMCKSTLLCLHLAAMEGLRTPKTEIFTDGNVTIGRLPLEGQIKGEVPDQARHKPASLLVDWG